MTGNLRPGAERTRASLDLLYTISRELAAQLNLRELLQRVLQLTLENVSAQSGSILVLDEEGKVMDGALAFGGRLHDHTAEQLADTFERGLAGWVVEHRQPVSIPSTRDDPRWLRRPDEQTDGESRSAVSVPLVARDRIVGVLTLVHPEAGHFVEDDLSLLTAIADQAGIAVENARLFRAEQERRRFASTLQEIARIISSTLDPAQVFTQVLEQLKRVVAFDSASIFLLEQDRLRLVASRGFSQEDGMLGMAMPVDSHILGASVLKSGKPRVADDVQQEPDWMITDDIPETYLIRGWIGVPLVVRDQVVGMLNVDSHQPNAYGPAELEVVSAFAYHAATAVANAQLFAQSQRQVQAMVALAETARVVTASLQLDEVLRRILVQTMHSMQTEAASLALINEETGQLEFKQAIGEGAQGIIGVTLPLGQGVAGWVAERGEAVVVPDVAVDPRFFRSADEQSGFATRAVACAPIRLHDRIIGVLEALNPERGEFEPEQIDLLMGIAGLAGTAIAHAQLFEETRAARQRYAGLFEDSVDPILISDLNAVITDANHRAQTFLGYERDELIGHSVLDLHLGQSAELPSKLASLKSGETFSYDEKIKHKQGQALPVELHVKRIELERQPTLQWILRDISERMALDELRNDLTSMIFHDLRSPLGNIVSSLEVLQASVGGGDEAVQSVLSIANRSSRRLSRLIDSLLDLSQLESGQAVLHRSPASIKSLITEAVEEVHPVAEAKGHQLQFHFEGGEIPPLEMDVDMIRRVLINLLENAIKYTRGGGTITVTSRRQGNEVLVGISDTGPGIAQRDQQMIFDKFARVQFEGRPKGLGLGLAFCRLAVVAHGGKIWVESEEGRGATFSFSLPL
jgi:NtrC-family two-component system sensor histidine kinase KinB